MPPAAHPQFQLRFVDFIHRKTNDTILRLHLYLSFFLLLILIFLFFEFLHLSVGDVDKLKLVDISFEFAPLSGVMPMNLNLWKFFIEVVLFVQGRCQQVEIHWMFL